MPAPRINMRKLKDALRLKFEGQQSHQQITTAQYAGIGEALDIGEPMRRVAPSNVRSEKPYGG